MKRPIVGSGGLFGGDEQPKQSAPVEQPDTLFSRAYANIIDLISEGEIEGLVNGLNSVYLDETPIVDDQGRTNFYGVTLETRNGSQTQSYFTGFNTIENEVTVGVGVTATTPVVRSITNPDIDAVRVRISFPGLSKTNDSGDITGTSVFYNIELQSNGGGYAVAFQETVTGKTTSKYERSVRIELTGSPPWDIRVVRNTADSTTQTLQNRTIWESYTEIIDGKLTYPNSALVALQIDSTQFNQIPRRAYEIKGIKCRVPANTITRDDGSLEYTSDVWNGAFRLTWTSNPAWIYYDLLTNKRYGCGAFFEDESVDVWSLYKIGKYCDELVSDGFGGLEPRFSCNLYIQERVEAFNFLRDLASAFNAMVYWANGTIFASQDAPDDPVYLYTEANVIGGEFQYQGSSAKTRSTVVLVSWNDPNDFYRRKVEYVEDTEGIARYGVIETQIEGFGCTSRGQANRLGRWMLYTNRYQAETVQFSVGLEGARALPGQLIKIADPSRAGSRRAGRIKSATINSITIDQTVTIDPSTHTLSVILPDGTVEEKNILSAGGNVITVQSNFTLTPQADSIWMLSSNDLQPQLFRVVRVAEGEKGVFTIQAVTHNVSKYDYIEKGWTLQAADITDLTGVPEAPTNLRLVESLYEVNGEVRVKAIFTWDVVRGASTYVLQYRRDETNLIQAPEVRVNEYELFNAEPGIYDFTVYAYSPLGKRSTGATGSGRVIGKALPPGEVQNFSMIPMAGQAYLSWDKSEDLDVLIGGSVRIRHTPETVAPVWRSAIDVVPALAGSANRASAPLLAGTYLAKFVDSSGNSSINAAAITTTIPEAIALNVVQTITESPTFSGTKTNMDYYVDYGGLAISGLLIDSVGPVDDVPIWDFIGGVSSDGSYRFAAPVDLTEVYTCRVTANIAVNAIDVTDAIDQRFEPIDDWLDVDSDFIDDVNAALYLRTTDDDPASPSAVWSVWKPFFVGDYSGRGFDFELRATSNSTYHTIAITTLEVTLDMPDRTIQINNLTSGTGTYAVSYAEPFKAVPSVGITAFNMASGDYWTITSSTRSGFNITFKNSSGTNVSRNFDVIARGYGRQLN